MTLPYHRTRDTTGYKLAGTETFRLSSAKLLGRWGGNAQNKNDKIRRLYVPDPGRVFVQTDQAGAEALIVAYLCPPGNFRQLFLNGIKPHTYVAMHIFKDYFTTIFPDLDTYLGAPIRFLAALPKWKEINNAIKKEDKKYYLGKKTVHSGNYGQRGPSFANVVLTETEGALVITGREATTFLETHHALFPEIRSWQDDTKRELYRVRCLRNLFGFPRQFGGMFNDELFRIAYAFVPQSTVGTITNIAFANLQTWIEDNHRDWDMLNNCHDSMLTQVPEGEEVECAVKQQEFMCQELRSPRGEIFKMKAESSVGRNWGKYHPEHNPEGMKEIVI